MTQLQHEGHGIKVTLRWNSWVCSIDFCIWMFRHWNVIWFVWAFLSSFCVFCHDSFKPFFYRRYFAECISERILKTHWCLMPLCRKL